MKNKAFKLIAIMLATALALTALVACDNNDDETPAGPETITITDGYDREVTIEKPVSNVATGLMTVSELMVSLGVEDLITGIDQYTAANEIYGVRLSSLPLIQIGEDNHYDVDFEKIIELDPDIFITGVTHQDGFDTIVETLDPIPVIALSYDTIEEIVASVTLLGELFDCQEAANAYIDFFQGTVDTITERVANIAEEDKPLVYYEWLPYTTFSEEAQTYHNPIVLSGGINVAADIATMYGTVEPEWVIEKDPDIIVAMAMNFAYYDYEAVACGYNVDDPSEIEAFHEAILNRSALSGVTAIKEEQVYVIYYELPVTSCIGFAYMAKWLHPDLFEDLDPQAIHQEYLTTFMGTDYDLDKHGVFVHPEP